MGIDGRGAAKAVRLWASVFRQERGSRRPSIAQKMGTLRFFWTVAPTWDMVLPAIGGSLALGQLIDERFSVLQVRLVEALREPLVDGCQQLVSGVQPAILAPKPRQTGAARSSSDRASWARAI